MPAENDLPQGAETGSDAPEAAESSAAVAQGLPAVSPDLVEEILAHGIDNIVPTHGYHQLPVVALGGSAGSIPALRAFFQTLPADSGMAYVVILHLSPDHTSTLPELLQQTTAMPVRAARDAERLEENHVYVIPPGKHLLVVDGHLRLTSLGPERGRRVAIDVFFRTLADTHGPHATAIVLSGADSDGANGIKRIKERGGLTVAQDPEEAEHPSMPTTAIDTGMVDWVLRVEDMPARILEYHANEAALRLPSEDGPQPAEPVAPMLDGDEAALREVLAFLRARTSHDFSYYKRATIVRRISRRMQINGLTNLPDYVSFLRTHPGEAGALLQDLLISVTNFFRDRDIFAALARDIIPTLFAGKGPDDTVRVWCAACATGEEPYSMAMLLVEHARTLDHPPGIQVFACELDEAAIAHARAGVYALSIAADVSEERLARFFIKDARGYRVRRELREMVLFAEHDLLKDAPFSKLDLASCRNLLIYLNREAQDRALEIFHFALKPQGKLFLGSSESVPEESDLFMPLDKKHRFYLRRTVSRVGVPVPTGIGTLHRVLHAQEAPVLPGPIFGRAVAETFSPASALPPSEERAALTELHFRFIERCAPPSVMINEHLDIIHLSEGAGRFLQPVGGQPTTNLLRMVHPALRTDLRGALFQVAETDASVEVFGVPLTMDGVSRMVDLRVAPAAELAPGYLLVSFAARNPDPAAVGGVASPRLETETVLRHLELEVEHVRGQLRDTVERYETNAEEYKSSHEELQSMNEELRNASEELDTGREELQSINEELSTVNLQLKHNVEELAHANSDLHNLMNATSIATVFLDRDLRIMRFTPEAVAIFHLIPGDAGRPLADLKQRIDYPGLEADARQVLRTLVPLEREVGEGGKWFLARLSPYRSLEERIEGVVLTFVDITERNRAEEARHESEEKYRTLFNSMVEAYCIIQMIYDGGGNPVDWRFLEVNPAFEKHNGVSDATGRTIRELVPDIEDKWMEICGRVAASGESVRFEESSPALAGRAFDLYAFRVGAPAERKVAVLFTDITGRKRAEERQAFLFRLGDALRSLDHPLEIQQAAMRMLGEQLDATRVFYFLTELEEAGNWIHLIETDYRRDPGMASHAGRHSVKDFGLRLFEGAETGKVVAVEDVTKVSLLTAVEVQRYLAVEAVAFINVPLIRNGRFVAGIGAHDSAPRPWKSEEIALIQEVAARVWASVERARAEEALRESEAWLAGQKEAFETAVVGAPLETSLRALVRTTVARTDAGVRCAFYIVDETGTELRHVTGMSAAYAECVDGFKVGPDALACGLAVYSGRPVITADVTREPLWKEWLWLAEKYRFRACWSFPIETEGRVVGTLAMYFELPREATPRDLALADRLTRAAAIIISRSREADERQRAEDALAESTARLHTAVALTGLGICRWDWVTHEMRGNDQRFLMCGFDPAAGVIPEEQYRGMLHPEDRETVWPRILRQLDERGEYAEEFRFILPDGTLRWLSEAGRVIDRQPDGRPWHVESALFDITTHRASESAIAESELRFRTLANALPQVIWTNHTDGTANYFNQGWYAYTGLSFERSNGPGWQAVGHPDDARVSGEKWQRALAAGEIFDSEFRLRRADGAYRWHIGRNVPLKDENGRVLGWFGSATDIEDLVRARAEAQSANAAKDQFLAVLSHELRTPLTPIIMALHTLARRGDLPEPVRQAHEMIQRNVQLEAHFIDDLLDMTRISRGKMEIVRQDMDLHEAARRAVEVSSPDLEAKGQSLTVSLDAREHRLNGDFARLQQAMWNLLKNAAKFTPEKRVIILRTRNEPGRVVVEVTDTGIGMEADALARVFRPFEQADASITRLFGGLGLGLAIARGTAEAHGGELRASSPGPGQGATFTLSLPL